MSDDLRSKKRPARPAFPGFPRAADLSSQPDVRSTCRTVYSQLRLVRDAQRQRDTETSENWSLYNGDMDVPHFYSGQSSHFVPIIHDSVQARETRTVNTLFPPSGKYIEALSEDGTRPSELLSLLDHYVRRAQLRTQVVPALCKSGDMEGQFTVSVGWGRIERHIVERQVELVPDPLDPFAPPIEVEFLQEGVELDEGPEVEVIPDPDLLVFPLSASSLEDALAQGGVVGIVRRWTKAKLRAMEAAGELEPAAVERVLGSLDSGSISDAGDDYEDRAEQQGEALGVNDGARGAVVTVFEAWFLAELPEGKRRVRAFIAAGGSILSVRRNPYWCDRLPILSVPVTRTPSSAKGLAPVGYAKTFQVLANDALNMGMDSVPYTVTPMWLSDPERNPNIDAMVQRPGAVWPTSPRDTQPVVVPPLWEQGVGVADFARGYAERTLSVSAAMLPQQTSSKKLNQAEIASEQQSALASTSAVATVLEEGILTPMLGLFVEFDRQFRETSTRVPLSAALGGPEKVVEVPPQEYDDKKYTFRWFGTGATLNEQRVQQQIATMNVLRGIPPQLYPRHRLDLSPIIELLVENAYGPRIGPDVFQELADLPPAELATTIAAKLGAGAPGAPGAGPAPGVPGQPGPFGPRPGAQPGQPRGGQAPPGAVHTDQMHSPGVMPRRAG